MSQTMIGRVLALLDAVADAGAISRRDLARATGLPPATANRIVASLLGQRLLAESPAGLRLGLRLFELGTLAGESGVSLLDVARPYLVDLHGAFGWTSQLAVLDGDAVIYLLKVDSHRRPRLDTRVAGRFPPHCTGAGKALLAFGPPETVDDVLGRAPLTARTPATITDRSRLAADLRATRRRGYAVDRGEFQPGMVGVAAPVRAAVGPVAAPVRAAVGPVPASGRPAAVPVRAAVGPVAPGRPAAVPVRAAVGPVAAPGRRVAASAGAAAGPVAAPGRSVAAAARPAGGLLAASGRTAGDLLAAADRRAGHPVAAVTLAGPAESFDVPRAAHALRIVAQIIESRLR